jgi:hypothetical protein
MDAAPRIALYWSLSFLGGRVADPDPGQRLPTKQNKLLNLIFKCWMLCCGSEIFLLKNRIAAPALARLKIFL